MLFFGTITTGDAQGEMLLSIMKLHAYTHKDGQLECKECKMTFPFKSQLEQHMPSHSLEQPFKCPEKGCRRRLVFCTFPVT